MLYIAMSIDGYIAKEDGDIGWLSIVDNPPEDYGYEDFVRTIDTVIMGRKAYEKVLSFDIEFPHKGRKCYVLSRTRTGLDENVEYFYDIEGLISELQSKCGKDIFIDGGAEIVNELLKLDIIDELIISVIPILLGSGIRLFKDNRPETLWELKSVTEYETGLAKLWYKKGSKK
jgi:dihydrofolate reductase